MVNNVFIQCNACKMRINLRIQMMLGSKEFVKTI